MGNFAKELHGMALFLKRVRMRILNPTEYLNLARQNLHGLPLAGRFPQLPRDADRTARPQPQDFRLVIHQAAFGDDLYARQRSTVIDLQEGEAALGITSGPDPAVKDHGRAIISPLQ